MDKKVYEYISQQTSDPIVERRTCRWTGEQFPIFTSESKLLQSYAPIIDGKTHQLSTPDQSPDARNIQRMLFRNDRVFYKWVSDHDGRQIVSIYYPGCPAKVYEVNAWYQDFRDPLSFGKSFTSWDDVWETLNTLTQEVPRLNVDGVGNTNSDYCNYCGYCKNCYMDIAGENNEDCYYCLFTKYSKKCADCTFVYNSEYCYESISCYQSSKIVYCQYLEECHDCHFSFDLKNCSHCLWCNNLRNQQYCIFNKQVSKEERQETISSITNGSHTGYQQWLETFHARRKEFIYPALFKINTEKSIGNDMKDTKNALFAFNVSEIEDSSYLHDVLHAKNCLDLNYSLYYPESSYQLMSTLELKNSICNVATHHSHHVYYCQLCNNSSDLFGCVGLNNKQYCIFNKQYTKEEYYKTLGIIFDQLIATKQRGTYFPSPLSLHPYNDTIANEYYPIHTVISGDKIDIINKEWRGTVTVLDPEKFVSDAMLDLGGEDKIPIKRRTREEEINIPDGISMLIADDLPDNNNETNKDITTKAIRCTISGRPYRIVGPEYELYTKLQIPIPRKHPDFRHQERMQMRPGRALHIRKCDKTGEDIISVYPQSAPFKVYSQKAYEKALY